MGDSYVPQTEIGFMAKTLVEPDSKEQSDYHQHLDKAYSTSKISVWDKIVAQKFFDLVMKCEELGLPDLTNKFSAKLQFMFDASRSVGGFLIIEGLNTQTQRTTSNSTTNTVPLEKSGIFGGQKQK